MKNFIFILILIVLTFALLFSFGIFTNLNTSFSKDFSLKKFPSIKAGMWSYEVYEVIGTPLSPKNENSICEYYSVPKSAMFSKFSGWRSVGVCYDPVGKVSETQNKIYFQ